MHVPLGGRAKFFVALGTAPSSDVTLDLSRHYDRRDSIRFDTDPDSDGDQSSLTFAKSAWSTPQAVTVRSVGAPGGVRSGAVVRLRPARSTGDSGYRYLSAVDVRVREIEAPGLVLSPSRLDVAEGGTASYQLRLAKEPASSVTVSISLGSGGRRPDGQGYRRRHGRRPAFGHRVHAGELELRAVGYAGGCG